MANSKKSSKQLQIDKTTLTIVIFVSLAAVITSVSLVFVKALLSQRSFQSRVITEQTASLQVVKADLAAVKSLSADYEAFDGASTNTIGGSSSGSGPKDGKNSQIVLDALPSQYDFPALVSSLEGVVKPRYRLVSLAGSDDAAANDAAVPSPAPLEIPFQMGVAGSYTAVSDLITVFEKSIRPISIKSMQLSGSDAALTINIDAKTYYQPAKKLEIKNKDVK